MHALRFMAPAATPRLADNQFAGALQEERAQVQWIGASRCLSRELVV